MKTQRFYTVYETFDILKTYKITSNIESVRRWLRQGEIEGIAPTSRKDGWKVTQEALDRFLAERLPDGIEITFNNTQAINTTNEAKENIKTIVVLNEEEIRANMWYQITRKNIWEGYIQIKKTALKQAAEHRQYSPALIEEVWSRCVANSSAYKQPRIPYLLDAFSFEGQRLKFDTAFESKEEQVIYALCEYVKKY
ncbi:MAG: hypothetical protein ABS949_17085 [Solibacillus sp.]